MLGRTRGSAAAAARAGGRERERDRGGGRERERATRTFEYRDHGAFRTHCVAQPRRHPSEVFRRQVQAADVVLRVAVVARRAVKARGDEQQVG